MENINPIVFTKFEGEIYAIPRINGYNYTRLKRQVSVKSKVCDLEKMMCCQGV